MPRFRAPKFADCDSRRAADRISPGGEACDVALLSCCKNCFVAAALFMTFRAFAEIIIIVGGSELSSLSCTFLMALGPNYPAHLTTRNPSTRSDRQTRQKECTELPIPPNEELQLALRGSSFNGCIHNALGTSKGNDSSEIELGTSLALSALALRGCSSRVKD